MKISYLDPTTLKPYKKNAKHHPQSQIDALKEAIEAFGFDQPIVVDSKLVIIKGHGRREAAIQLGMEEVPVVVREISANEAKFLRVADNEVNSVEWDTNALKAELRDLDGVGLDLDITGFTLDDRQQLELSIPSDTKESIEVGEINTKYECDKCGYKW